MTEPMMCLTSAASKPETEIPGDDVLATYREAGFDHIVYWGVELSQPWADAIYRLHNLGFKIIARWPHHGACGNLLPEYGFRAWEGHGNEMGNARLAGPSHWHPAVFDRAAPSLKPIVDMGLDGVLISLLECDRPMPTDWYGTLELSHYANAFWCFDEHARADWAAVSDNDWMPHRSDQPDTVTDTFKFFYSWYQAGWLRRLLEYSIVAEAAGVKDIWTWFTPITEWAPDGLANGTADAVDVLHHGWYEPLVKSGGRPVVVSPVCANLWPKWWAQGVHSMRYATQQLGWRAISGPGCNQGAEVATHNLRENSAGLADIGFCGPFAGMSFLQGQPDLKEAGLTAREHFRKGVTHPVGDYQFVQAVPVLDDGDDGSGAEEGDTTGDDGDAE